MNRFLILVASTFLIGAGVSQAAEKGKDEKRQQLFQNLTQGMAPGSTPGPPIELKALEIRAKIHEPQVIYILDRSKIDIQVTDEEQKFSPRILNPILDNTF